MPPVLDNMDGSKHKLRLGKVGAEVTWTVESLAASSPMAAPPAVLPSSAVPAAEDTAASITAVTVDGVHVGEQFHAQPFNEPGYESDSDDHDVFQYANPSPLAEVGDVDAHLADREPDQDQTGETSEPPAMCNTENIDRLTVSWNSLQDANFHRAVKFWFQPGRPHSMRLATRSIHQAFVASLSKAVCSRLYTNLRHKENWNAVGLHIIARCRSVTELTLAICHAAYECMRAYIPVHCRGTCRAAPQGYPDCNVLPVSYATACSHPRSAPED